ncbi:MAG: ABC transporter ATP-binding protein [bacterium]|nr:ABC transporter ATP-binding protein [bacterium]
MQEGELRDRELIRMESISKRFGEVRANENINLTIRQGEVHAILGENGAGKSTLMNILSGIYSPDGGSIYLKGEQTVFSSPQDAIRSGIGMIYQHFKLVDVMTAWENISAGPDRSFFLNSKKLKKTILALCEDSGLRVNLDKKIYNMAVSEKQTVEIVKALYRGAEILILDEPTAVLTPQETEKLFAIVSNMRDAGNTVLIITHKLYEVMEISDRVTVLRKGHTVATVATNNTSQKQLAEMMVGEAVRMEVPRVSGEKKDTLLVVRDLVVEDEEGKRRLEEISFTLWGGEILGVAGIAGSGQKQLCEALVGLLKIQSGEILVKGENVTGLSAKDIIERGTIRLNFVPEDRLGMGLVGSMNMIDNVMLKDYRQTPGRFLDRTSAERTSKTLVESLNIQHPGLRHPISVLSGGNIQKVLIGRELIAQPDILIAAYPVRGLDVGVTNTVLDLLNEQKQQGAGILFIGEDLDLLLELCDRIIVLCNGRIVSILDAEETNKEEIGLMMCGSGWEVDD